MLAWEKRGEEGKRFDQLRCMWHRHIGGRVIAMLDLSIKPKYHLSIAVGNLP